MSRLPPLDINRLSEDQRGVYDAIATSPRGEVRGPFPVLLRSPGMADAVQRAGAYIRYRSGLPAKLREFAILLVSRYWGAEFEWYAHAPIAAKEGLAAETIEAIRLNRPLALSDPAEKTVYELCTELLRIGRASDARYDAALQLLGEALLVDLVAMTGYYSMLAMTLNAFRVEVPDGPRPFGGDVGKTGGTD